MDEKKRLEQSRIQRNQQDQTRIQKNQQDQSRIQKNQQDQFQYEMGLEFDEQMKQQFELQKIAVKGEEDRKTEELKGYIDAEIELIKADANMISFNAEVGDSAKQAGLERLENARISSVFKDFRLL